MPTDYKIKPLLSPAGKQFHLGGPLEAYLRGVTAQWLLTAPEANPGMLEMFRDRDRNPSRNLEPWAGEFAGKYLTEAVQVLRVSGDPQLKKYLESFVAELISLQAEDGYLGPWQEASRLTNHIYYPDGYVKDIWDTWAHYHIMLGLLLYYENTGEQSALDCACRIGDMICDRYAGNPSPRLVQTGNTEMNLAPAHSLGLLYRHTGNTAYLKMAHQLVDEEFGMQDDNGQWLAGNWMNGALEGQDFYQLPKPRWESLHPIMALAELYWLTGDVKYQHAFQNIWWSIVRLDRHNNGGFSSGEQAQGNPFHPGAIETCCTIAWTALTVEMLKMTGDSRVADELELTLFNSIIGMHSYTGRWAAYNTPMDGVRLASAHQIVFQAREGTPELNCCSVNSARGFGMISDWAVMCDSGGVVLNLYAPGDITATLPSQTDVKLAIQTKYPLDGRVTITVNPSQAEEFTLSLRIPRWSADTRVSVNGQQMDDIKSGSYLSLHRTWNSGDIIVLDLDMSFHCWIGAKECAGKTSLYRGPILLTYDRRFNKMDPMEIPTLDAHELTGKLVDWPGRIPPIMLLSFTATDGQTLNLCDFGSAGEGGTPYYSWLKITNAAKELPQYFSEFS